MELSHRSRCASGICTAAPGNGARRIFLAACAVVMLAGCSNAAQIGPTPGRTLDAPIPAVKVDSPTSHPMGSPMSGEVLTATSVHVTCNRTRTYKTRGKFSVSGTASGPYPGTFTAHGRWILVDWIYGLSFGLNEYFAISSGKNTFSGRMRQDNNYEFYGSPCKPASSDLKYFLENSGWTGSASVHISKHSFREAFNN